MNLAPSETEKLLQAVAGMVARDRLARGVKLNYPESVALLSTWVIERAREGGNVSDLMTSGREVLIWDRTTGALVQRLGIGTGVDVLVAAYRPGDDRVLAVLGDGRLATWPVVLVP